DRWRPAALALAAWLPVARDAHRLDPVIKQLKAAADWLTAFAGRVRDERFAPIAGQVQQVWERLRHDSNVCIDAVELTGKGNQRRVQLRVSVDGAEGAALAVMSQGELHAVALSLFLPRATLAASPFRFLVIDDPVQAMDAARVDGLARVLAEVADTHQVVVFTHDERLPEACRRLGVRSRVLEVTRGDRSKITVRLRSDPVEVYLDDARAVLRTDAYPAQARRRVVPGLCRNAVEAACTTVIRRRRIVAGQGHAEVERLLDVHSRLIPRLALAFFDDANRHGDVLTHVNTKLGSTAGDTVVALNRGAHELIDARPELLVDQAQRIARAVLALA
ncbi:MAG: hypothetical protein M3P34_06710, partial [Actinomycetota bacterium]|nr:hypothetical protein [Actinomycetota bacterium]